MRRPQFMAGTPRSPPTVVVHIMCPRCPANNPTPSPQLANTSSTPGLSISLLSNKTESGATLAGTGCKGRGMHELWRRIHWHEVAQEALLQTHGRHRTHTPPPSCPFATPATCTTPLPSTHISHPHHIAPGMAWRSQQHNDMSVSAKAVPIRDAANWMDSNPDMTSFAAGIEVAATDIVLLHVMSAFLDADRT